MEFLHKKGFADVTEDLNQKLTDEQYNLLVAEYSQDKSIREEANRFLQDRMSRKAAPEEPVQEEKPARKEPEMIETVIPEEPVIKFKTVGKIDLGSPKAEAKEEPKPEPVQKKEPAKPAQPKAEPVQPKKEVEKPAEPAKKEPAVREEPKVEPKKPVAVPKAEPVKVEPEPEVEKVSEEVAEPAVAFDTEEDASKEELFKISAPQNGGINIKTVGKIDLTAINQSTRPKKKSKEEKKKEREAKEQQRQQQRQQFKESLMKEIKSDDKSQGGDAPRKKNRVRIGGEKVDLSKADSYGQSQNEGHGKDSQKGGGRNNKDHRFNKADKAEFSNVFILPIGSRAQVQFFA